jgi:long-chain acyl-CoA synthetase
MNIFNILIESAEKWGSKHAVIHNKESITYDELHHNANELKSELTKNGIEEGIAIAIIFPNSIDFIVSLMAATGTGAITMPIHHNQKEAEIKLALKNGQIHYFISDSENLIQLAISSKQINVFGKTYTLYKTKGKENDKTAQFIKEPAFMRFTSGTTGVAKGVIMSHKSVVERVESTNEVLSLNENDNVLWLLPMAFHFVVSIVLYLKYGTTIIINDSFLAEDIIQNIKEHKVSFFYSSPIHIKLLSSYPNKIELPSLKKVISTTTAISLDVCNSFYSKYDIPVSQAYGIIEIGLPIINTKKSKQSPEAVGNCLPAYTVGILDKNYNEVPKNNIGLLGIKGPGMFDGYLTPETKRQDTLVNNWFLTGDYAVRNNDGLITIKGREKNVINVSGNKVFPYEIEDIINAYPNILLSKAYSKKHPLLGEIVALDIVRDSNFEINKEELINHTRKLLSDYKVPQVINFVEKIEMTVSGKIKR